MIRLYQHGGYVRDMCDEKVDDVYMPIDLDCGEILMEKVGNLIGSMFASRCELMSLFDNKLGFNSCSSELN